MDTSSADGEQNAGNPANWVPGNLGDRPLEDSMDSRGGFVSDREGDRAAAQLRVRQLLTASKGDVERLEAKIDQVASALERIAHALETPARMAALRAEIFGP